MGSGVGPVLMIKLAESGASSGDHAQMAEVAAAGIEWSEDQMVFLTEKGVPVNPGTWWKHFQLLAGKLGLPRVKPHSFRHKASTTDNRAGVDPNTRMLQRGRVSMESERAVYIHPDLLDQHVAAEASHRVFFERRETLPGQASSLSDE